MNRTLCQFLLLLVSAVTVTYISVTLLPPVVREKCYDAVRVRQVIPSESDVALYTGQSASVSFSTEPEKPVITAVSLAVSEGESVEVSGSDVTALSPGMSRLALNVDGVEAEISVRVIDKPLPPGSDLPPLYKDVLTAVNVNSRLTADYKPETVDFPSYIHKNRSTIQMEKEPMDHFLEMYRDVLSLTGQELWIISAYRTYEFQQTLFERSVGEYMARGYSRAEAEALAGQTTQPPGCSEHQLGNSMDLGTSSELTYAFKDTPAGKYVTEHAHEYGFILRYPADKTDKTGISYESWHFRYVGREHAAYIYEHSLCLEEYIELQNKAAEEVEKFAETVSAKEYLSMIGE